MYASLAEIFFSRYEGKYTLGRSEGLFYFNNRARIIYKGVSIVASCGKYPLQYPLNSTACAPKLVRK